MGPEGDRRAPKVMGSLGGFVGEKGVFVSDMFLLVLTFDLQWGSVVARSQEPAQVDGDIGYLAGAEDGGVLQG